MSEAIPSSAANGTIGRTRTGSGRGAFTLVEIMMAITIFSFAIIPLSMFLRTGSKTVEGTRDLAGAVCLAQKTLEQCRSYPFELLQKTPATPAGVETAQEALDKDKSLTMGRITYTRTLTFKPLSAGSGFDGCLLHLQIAWTPHGQEKPLEYETWTVLSPSK